MDEITKKVQAFYDAGVETEWNRIAGKPEFLLTCRMLDRYIKEGDKVLDIGGGPGRYALYLAEKGCDVTLLDLSPENVKFAAAQAAERGLALQTAVGDARNASRLISETFDHVLLMGPLYHLLAERQRAQAVTEALSVLKPAGVLFASFISSYGGVIYAMKNAPEQIVQEDCGYFFERFAQDLDFSGDGFTESYFARHSEILPFMAGFPLEKLHFFGQEGICAPCENILTAQPAEVYQGWLDLCETVWEREDLLSWSEHLMYVGRKKA